MAEGYLRDTLYKLILSRRSTGLAGTMIIHNKMGANIQKKISITHTFVGTLIDIKLLPILWRDGENDVQQVFVFIESYEHHSHI